MFMPHLQHRLVCQIHREVLGFQVNPKGTMRSDMDFRELSHHYTYSILIPLKILIPNNYIPGIHSHLEVPALLCHLQHPTREDSVSQFSTLR